MNTLPLWGVLPCPQRWHPCLSCRAQSPYEHIQEQIGNRRRIMFRPAGLSNVWQKPVILIELDKHKPKILQRLKDLEVRVSIQAAEASFDLLMREALGKQLTLFEIKGFQVHCDLVKE